MAHDVLLVVSLHLIIGAVRAGLQPVRLVGPAVFEIAPHGTFPRVEMVCAVVIGLAVFGNYRAGRFRNNSRALFAGSMLGLSLVAWTDLWYSFSIARGVGFVLAILGLGTALVWDRMWVNWLVSRFRPDKRELCRALVIGTAPGAERAVAMAAKLADSSFDVIGFLDVSLHPSERALGSVSDLVWLVELHRIDTILLADISDDDMMGDILRVADDLGCSAIAGLYSYPFHGFVPTVIHRRGVPHFAFARPSLLAHQLLLKRALDFTLAAILVVVMAPIIGLIAAAIRLDSPGPIFYRATRVGFGGRNFRMVKFRSMTVDAESRRAELRSASLYEDGRLFKIPSDPRITRVGRFLRRSSLDELPQLWNVLRGEMSLVGPRPPLLDEVSTYEEYHYDRFGMKPGMTGPWQVSGRNSIRDFDIVVQLETEYIQGWSILRDLHVLLRTVPAVLSMSGV
jgi:exopolysaccharide biosynthesis polyprenyl glycosylphosphotransferase